MDSPKFLSIDEENISIAQALQYLREAGELPKLVQRVLRQHVLGQIMVTTTIEVDEPAVEQAIVNFRIQNRLTNQEQFQQWLQSRNIDYKGFRDRLAEGMKLEQLKQQVTEEKVQAYFEQNKALLDQVVYSRIVVEDTAKAEELKRQLTEDGAVFEQLVKEHSIASDRLVNGVTGPVAMGQLPEPLRNLLAGKEPGTLVGPVDVQGKAALIRVDSWLPATLEGNLKRQLQEQAFEQWWQENLKDKKIKLYLDVPTDPNQLPSEPDQL